MNQKQIIAENKKLYQAVYFDGEKRLLTYDGINMTEACLKLIEYQRANGINVAMLLFPAHSLPILEVSWDRKDYEKYLEKLARCKECNGYGVVNADGYCNTCANCKEQLAEAN